MDIYILMLKVIFRFVKLTMNLTEQIDDYISKPFYDANHRVVDSTQISSQVRIQMLVEIGKPFLCSGLVDAKGIKRLGTFRT